MPPRTRCSTPTTRCCRWPWRSSAESTARSGPILGAVLLGVASEYLKLKIPYGHLVVYGIIIVIVILFMPQGLYGLYRGWARRRSAERMARAAAARGRPWPREAAGPREAIGG